MAATTGKEVDGLPWHDAAVANARWAGASLRDVFAYAGINIPTSLSGKGEQDKEGKHVVFASRRAGACEHAAYYEVSVPLAKALAEDGGVVLAYEVCPCCIAGSEHSMAFR